MNRSKQNLYLFFEENESYWDVVNSNLVSIYMNRYVIDEEMQNEITGAYKLMKVPREKTRPYETMVERGYRPFHRWTFSTEKESFDSQIFECAYNDAKQRVNTAHFIIGTNHLFGFGINNPNNDFEKWVVICRLETYIGNKLDWKHIFRLET